MKKLHSLFILSILALTMFVGCQMNTDSVEELEYTITIDSPHGTLELNKTKAKAGETVKILKYIADEGYRFKSVNAYKDDNTLVEPNPDHTSFVMPSCNVKIVAEYEAISNDDNNNDDDTQTEGEDDNGDGEEAEDPVDETPNPINDDGDEGVEEPKTNEYGFISSEEYTVKFTDGSSTTMTGEELTNAAKDTGMVNGTDYTINGKTVTLTASGMGRMTSYLANGGSSSGGDTPTDDTSSDDDNTEENPTPNPTETSETYKVNHGNDTGTYSLVFDNYKAGYTKGETVKFLIKNGDATPTETELYLVNVRIEDSYGNDIKSTVGLKIEDHKITFTMPSNTVNVSASFEDVWFESSKKIDDLVIAVYGDGKGKPVVSDFDVGLYFDTKDFDNLRLIDNKYVFRVAKMSDTYNYGDGYYICKITSTAKNYKFCAIVGEKIWPSLDGQINIKSAN